MFFERKKINATEVVDEIQKIVGEKILKPAGFKKFGRTYNRVVDGDIVQVINFQNGCPAKGVTGVLWINIGIRVPEREERKFIIEKPLKRYYKEYECDIRTTLGEVSKGTMEYNLRKEPQKIAADIIEKIQKYVFPMFDALDTRDKIIENEEKYDYCTMFAHLKDLHNVMIYGRRGEMEKATQLFKKYYEAEVDEFLKDKEINGEKIDGAIVYYKPNSGHIEYLNNLADELGIEIEKFKAE